MGNIFKLVWLSTALIFLFSVTTYAQEPTYSKDQLIGKWILKSAVFNGIGVPFTHNDHEVFFEFFPEGVVNFQSFDGKNKSGMFVIRDDKIIDPNIPEQKGVKILSLTEASLVLVMYEQSGEMIMTFELSMEEETPKPRLSKTKPQP